jgi:hypothetical protein
MDNMLGCRCLLLAMTGILGGCGPARLEASSPRAATEEAPPMLGVSADQSQEVSTPVAAAPVQPSSEDAKVIEASVANKQKQKLGAKKTYIAPLSCGQDVKTAASPQCNCFGKDKHPTCNDP